MVYRRQNTPLYWIKSDLSPPDSPMDLLVTALALLAGALVLWRSRVALLARLAVPLCREALRPQQDPTAPSTRQGLVCMGMLLLGVGLRLATAGLVMAAVIWLAHTLGVSKANTVWAQLSAWPWWLLSVIGAAALLVLPAPKRQSSWWR